MTTLAERWDSEPLRRNAVGLYEELVRDGARFTNWYERMMRRSTAMKDTVTVP